MRPSEGKFDWWPIGVVAFFVIVLMLSISVNMRLVGNAPGEFLQTVVKDGRRADPDGAKEYWDVAVNVVQWRYGHASLLPPEPPPEFALPAESKVSRNPATRLAYWKKLRELWTRPEVWRRRVEVDFRWPFRAAQTFIDGTREFIRTSTS